MDWSPIVTTTLGGVLALSGGFIGQWWGDKQAVAREGRDRAHERDVWARSLRYKAHVAFLSEFDRRFDTVQNAKQNPLDGSEPPDDYLVPVWDRYQAVRLVCTTSTANACEKALQALMNYTFREADWESAMYERDQYLAAVREEFGLSPVPVMGG